MVQVVTIDKDSGGYVVDNKTKSGAPPIGRGRTMLEAIGAYMIANQKELGIEFTVEPAAQKAEDARRARYRKVR